jgi:hypothetical protein
MPGSLAAPGARLDERHGVVGRRAGDEAAEPVGRVDEGERRVEAELVLADLEGPSRLLLQRADRRADPEGERVRVVEVGAAVRTCTASSYGVPNSSTPPGRSARDGDRIASR